MTFINPEGNVCDCRIHLIPTRGNLTVCGKKIDMVATDADINWVTCDECFEIHEGISDSYESA